jgi:hypothetical protein
MKKSNQYRNHATKTIQHVKKKKKQHLIQVSIKTIQCNKNKLKIPNVFP